MRFFSEHRLIWENPPAELPAKEPGPPGQQTQAPDHKEKREKYDEHGADLADFLKGLEQLTTTDKQAFKQQTDKWDQAGSIHEIRTAGVNDQEDEKNPLKKHLLLASQFLDWDKTQTGRMVYKVNFQNNMLAENKVGMGDMLPAEIAEVKVTGPDGEVVTQRAFRAINLANHRIGYYDAETYEKTGELKYIPVFTGSTIEVLSTYPSDHQVVQKQKISENVELFRQDPESTGPEQVRSYNQVKSYKRSPVHTEHTMEINGKHYARLGRKDFIEMMSDNETTIDQNFIVRKDPLNQGPLTFMGINIGATNKYSVPLLKQVEANLKAKGIQQPFKTVQSFNYRPVEGSTSNPPPLSIHSWGLAWDFDPEKNPQGAEITTITPEFVAEMKACGFTWGGDFKPPTPVDKMHFELALDFTDPNAINDIVTDPKAKEYAATIYKNLPQRPKEELPVTDGKARLKQGQVDHFKADETTTQLNRYDQKVLDRVKTYDNYIKEASEETGVPVNLLRAVMMQESGGRPGIASPVGAGGLMQFMPGTAVSYGFSRSEMYPTIRTGKGYSLDPRDGRNDPRRIIFAGAKLLRDNLLMYQDYPQKIEFALSAYNAGPGRVSKLRRNPETKRLEVAPGSEPHIPRIQETQIYVRRIMNFYRVLNSQEDLA